jgi:aclacinomycin oxidase
VVPFLKWALSYGTEVGDFGRIKSKGAYMRRPWTDEQVATVYRHLTGPLRGGLFSVLLYSYGSAINRVDPAATAVPQRDSIMKAWYSVFWADPTYDPGNIAQVRTVYRDVHQATGGAPVPGTTTDGLYINYPDVDMVDPEWNASGVHWTRLYYKDNYPRLQQVKARYDPRNLFRHTLSVRLPS